MYGDPCRTLTAEAPSRTKGEPIRAIENGQRDLLSDTAIDCRQFNAVSVQVIAAGGLAEATVSVEGGSQSGGTYLPLPDPNAVNAVTESVNFDCVVGTPWVRVRLSSYVTGIFTVIVTPYLSPGLTKVEITSAVSTIESSGDGEIDTLTSSPVNVTNASAVVLAANANRAFMLLQNVSDEDIWINLGAAAVVGGGFCKLRVRTGAVWLNRKAGNLYLGAVQAIHNGVGNKVLLVTEGT